jgi:hypothetical protein
MSSVGVVSSELISVGTGVWRRGDEARMGVAQCRGINVLLGIIVQTTPMAWQVCTFKQVKTQTTAKVGGVSCVCMCVCLCVCVCAVALG